MIELSQRDRNADEKLVGNRSVSNIVSIIASTIATSLIEAISTPVTSLKSIPGHRHVVQKYAPLWVFRLFVSRNQERDTTV